METVAPSALSVCTAMPLSHGRPSPGVWVGRDGAETALAHLREVCQWLECLELPNEPTRTQGLFTEREQARWEQLGQRRRRSFAGARTALKRLARRISGYDGPAHTIETMHQDGIRPACRLPDGPVAEHVSAAHDEHLVLACAADAPIGCDVETLRERITRSVRLFMSEDEIRTAECAGMPFAAAATRVWSIKESVAKMMNLPLPEALSAARCTSLGAARSRVEAGGRRHVAYHAEVGPHILTVLLGDADEQ